VWFGFEVSGLNTSRTGFPVRFFLEQMITIFEQKFQFLSAFQMAILQNSIFPQCNF